MNPNQDLVTGERCKFTPPYKTIQLKKYVVRFINFYKDLSSTILETTHTNSSIDSITKKNYSFKEALPHFLNRFQIKGEHPNMWLYFIQILPILFLVVLMPKKLIKFDWHKNSDGRYMSTVSH